MIKYVSGICLFLLGSLTAWVWLTFQDEGVASIEESQSSDVTDASRSNRSGAVRNQGGIYSTATNDDGRLDDGATDKVSYFRDGSIKIPASLINRLWLNLVKNNYEINAKEMMLFGFTEEQSQSLQDMLKELESEALVMEADKATIIPSNTDEIIIEIEGGDNLGYIKEEVDARLEKIGGEKAGLLKSALESTISEITADFGKMKRVVRLGKGKSGNEIFEVLSFKPDAIKSLTDDGRRDFDFYRKYSWGRKEYPASELPARLRLLFDDSEK